MAVSKLGTITPLLLKTEVSVQHTVNLIIENAVQLIL